LTTIGGGPEDDDLRSVYASMLGVAPDRVVIRPDHVLILATEPGSEDTRLSRADMGTEERLAAAAARDYRIEPQEDEFDLTDEVPDIISAGRIYRQELPPKEQVRRTTMVVLAIVWGLIFALNVGFTLALSDADYADVGGVINTAWGVVGGFLGAAVGYYFAGKD
jgi:hypothetical protein